jgi:transcriptional regulator with XRE-family HTH domain
MQPPHFSPNAIRQIRRRAGNMSQAEFGRAVGKSLRSVQDWESGKSEPHARTREAILAIARERGLVDLVDGRYRWIADRALDPEKLAPPEPPPEPARVSVIAAAGRVFGSVMKGREKPAAPRQDGKRAVAQTSAPRREIVAQRPPTRVRVQPDDGDGDDTAGAYHSVLAALDGVLKLWVSRKTDDATVAAPTPKIEHNLPAVYRLPPPPAERRPPPMPEPLPPPGYAPAPYVPAWLAAQMHARDVVANIPEPELFAVLDHGIGIAGTVTDQRVCGALVYLELDGIPATTTCLHPMERGPCPHHQAPAARAATRAALLAIPSAPPVQMRIEPRRSMVRVKRRI